MTPTDRINQQAVASYVGEAIWPGNKMLPKGWSKWRDDKRRLVLIPAGAVFYCTVTFRKSTSV